MATCCRDFRQEFRLKRMSLRHDSVAEFVYCQWPIYHPLFVIIRAVMFAYTLFGISHTVYTYGGKTFKFFTVWSYCLLSVHLAVATMLAIWPYVPRKSRRSIQLTGQFPGDGVINKKNRAPGKQPRKSNMWSTATAMSSHSETTDGVSNYGCEMEELGTSVARNPSADKNSAPASSNGGYSSDTGLGKNSAIYTQERDDNNKTKPGKDANNTKLFENAVSGGSDVTSRGCHYRDGLDKKLLPGPFWVNVSWLLATMSSLSAPIVSIIYFGAIFPSQGHDSVGLVDTKIHVLNLVFVLVDHMISARPVRILHCIAGIFYILLYGIFSVVFWDLDRKNNVIYDILDWNKPALATAVSVGLVTVMFVMQILYFLLYRAMVGNKK